MSPKAAKITIEMISWLIVVYYIILGKITIEILRPLILHNFDFANSDSSLCIVHIVPFVCCIIHVLSILLVDCCMTYIILVCPVYDRHHVANGWLIVASFITCAYILIVAYYHHLCIYRIHVLPNQNNNLLTTPNNGN